MSKKTIISVEQDINLMVKVPVKGKKKKKKTRPIQLKTAQKEKEKKKRSQFQTSTTLQCANIHLNALLYGTARFLYSLASATARKLLPELSLLQN